MSIKLKPHNEIAHKAVKKLFEIKNKAAVIHPTGTGKSFIALKLIEENPDKKIVYLSPSIPIMMQLKKNMIKNRVNFRNVERISYQKLTALNQNEELNIDADIIILDEFHHCGAPEWGKAVEELLNKNPNAKVLGLSATPMRYFDEEIRDMAEELFDNNIASEMTLEDAIANGILKEPIYTAGLYEYDQITSELEEKIENCQDEEKRKIAKEELENLRALLQASVDGLPEVLEKAMTNKEGKYIVYCKDIADMEKKMAEASELFGKVNSDIEIMSISSRDEDIRKNEETIKKFEKGKDNGKLKLLFSVNMLNEGYHLENLDGVIMMRPTHSPTLYYQQLGRALSVGNDKQPIVIDLVNNIDTIEIIEGFCKRLGEAKEKNNVESSTKFSISEETRRISDIVNKIDSLVSRTKPLSTEEKLALMMEYINKVGDKIVNGTIYKGYNIGAMKNNLRQAYYNGNLEIDENLLQSFIDAGIIVEEKERIRTSEQEKYEFLISSLEKSLEERKKMTMESGLSYDAARHWLQMKYNRGLLKLTEEQIQKLKANGLLNLSSKEKEELKLKHEKLLESGMKINEIIDIERQYGSFEIFMEKFKRGECEYPFLNSVFVGAKCIVVSSREITEEQKLHYVELVESVLNEDITYKDGYYINIDKIDDVLKELTPREEKVIRMSFGLDGKKIDICQIAEEIGRKTRPYDVVRNAVRHLKNPRRIKDMHVQDLSKELKQIEEKSNRIKTELDNALKMKKFIIDENVKTHIDIASLEANGISKEDFEDFFNVSLSHDKIIVSNHNKVESDITIEELNFSVRTYNAIKKRAGIDTISDFIDRDVASIEKTRNLGKISFDEVITKLATFGIEIVEDEDGIRKFKHKKELSENLNNDLDLIEKCDKENLSYVILSDSNINSSDENKAKQDSDIMIEELNLSRRVYIAIRRSNGIDTISDFIDRDVADIKNLRGLGKIGFNELVTELATFGIEIVEDEDGIRKFKHKKELSENLNDDLNLVEKCDKEINILTEMLSSLEEEKERFNKKAEAYGSIYKHYLENENIFDPNYIIPAITDTEQIQLFGLNNQDRTKSNKIEIVEESEEQKRKRELIESIRESQEELEYIEDEIDMLDEDFFEDFDDDEI